MPIVALKNFLFSFILILGAQIMMILQNYTMHKKQKPEFNPNNITTNRHIYGPRCSSTRTSKSNTGCEPMKLKVEQKKNHACITDPPRESSAEPYLPVCLSMSSMFVWKTWSTASTLTPVPLCGMAKTSTTLTV